MEPKIGLILSAVDLSDFQYISTYGVYKIYLLEEDVSFLIAIDQTNLICGCFEFHEVEDGFQLAHMYVLPNLKRQGIGKAILKESVNIWETFELPSTDNDAMYYYIENGYNFIVSCFEEGILNEPNFKNPERNNYEY